MDPAPAAFRSSLYGPAQAIPTPSPNYTYRRSDGLRLASDGPVLPVSLQRQLQFISGADLRGVERRMRLEEREAARTAAISQRVVAASANRQSAADVLATRLMKRAARHAKADGEGAIRRAFEEYKRTGRM